MHRFRSNRLLYSGMLPIALVVAVLVVGFGTLIHAHGVSADAPARVAGIVYAGDGGFSVTPAIHTSLDRHCGEGAVCFEALPHTTFDLAAPEPDHDRFFMMRKIARQYSVYGLLRPPQQS